MPGNNGKHGPCPLGNGRHGLLSNHEWRSRRTALLLARAAKLIAFRCIFIYGLCIIFVTLLVPSNDPRLQGSTSNVGNSPFVMSLVIAGIQGLPDFLNAVMMIGVAAIAGESIYVASRVMRSMAVQKLIPTWFCIGQPYLPTQMWQ